jgi:hypothetical protein
MLDLLRLGNIGMIWQMRAENAAKELKFTG